MLGTTLMPVTLANASIDTLQTGIPAGGLPKTFRDAINITSCLRIRYLWIDSLCIVQDDKADWEREAARMAEVY